MKKVIIFGATGSIGIEVIKQNLSVGNLVTAFCRTPEKLSDIKHKNLTIAIGDVFIKDDVEKSVVDQDVVIVTLGSGKQRKSIVRSGGTQNIIQAMQKHGIKRIICQSTLGTGATQGNLNFFWKRIMFGWYLKQVFLDHELQEKIVRGSGLDWTIVRPAAFTDGELTQNYRYNFPSNDRSVTLKISRADVADFIVKQIDSKEFLHQSPGLSY